MQKLNSTMPIHFYHTSQNPPPIYLTKILKVHVSQILLIFYLRTYFFILNIDEICAIFEHL